MDSINSDGIFYDFLRNFFGREFCIIFKFFHDAQRSLVIRTQKDKANNQKIAFSDLVSEQSYFRQEGKYNRCRISNGFQQRLGCCEIQA